MFHSKIIVKTFLYLLVVTAISCQRSKDSYSMENGDSDMNCDWKFSEISRLIEQEESVSIKEIISIEIVSPCGLKVLTAEGGILSGRGYYAYLSFIDDRWVIEEVSYVDF